MKILSVHNVQKLMSYKKTSIIILVSLHFELASSFIYIFQTDLGEISKKINRMIFETRNVKIDCVLFHILRYFDYVRRGGT